MAAKIRVCCSGQGCNDLLAARVLESVGLACLTNQFIILRGELEEKVPAKLCHAQRVALTLFFQQFHAPRGQHKEYEDIIFLPHNKEINYHQRLEIHDNQWFGWTPDISLSTKCNSTPLMLMMSKNCETSFWWFLYGDNYASSSAICWSIFSHYCERNVESLFLAVSNSTVSPHTLCDKHSATPSPFYIQTQAQTVLKEGIKVGVWCSWQAEIDMQEALHIAVLRPKIPHFNALRLMLYWRHHEFCFQPSVFRHIP